MSKYEEFLDVLLQVVKADKAYAYFVCSTYARWKSKFCNEDTTTFSNSSEASIESHIKELKEVLSIRGN